ncbi:tRNA adenosine deaminase-associated protein [Aeromicrobium sp. CF4.19]|uniref:tRNA adenosine deaminase-associated protein n=1 Tax=Aeromicrobium sp. CF4.19 TaxID=3373082 RepID=UPI003EE7C96D
MPQDDDLALAAYRDSGQWQLVELLPAVTADLDGLVRALDRFPSDCGVLGLVAGENAFLLLRRSGTSTRALLSDASEVTVWSLAEDVADVLDLPEAEDDDVLEPVGALDVLSDLGMSAADLLDLCLDDDLWPEEALAEVAQQLGFGEQYETILG